MRIETKEDKMSATRSLRIDEALVRDAQRRGKVEHRSINNQVEFWARLGRAVAGNMSIADAYAVSQGLKRIKLELVNSAPVDPKTVLANLKNRDGRMGKPPVTQAPFYYEASGTPGFMDRVETATGKRETGTFKNGKFEAAQ